MADGETGNMSTKADKQLERVRKICNAFPETVEKISHGAPTFFAGGKKVFAMFNDDHHGDGHLAVWVPAPDGAQEILIESDPATYFRPAYVGHKGWIGIELPKVKKAALEAHIQEAWQMTAPRKLLATYLNDPE